METTESTITQTGQGLEKLINAVCLPDNRVEMPMGTFKGKVLDAGTGGRVFGVVVELVGTGRTYITSPTGYFKLTDVPEGIYLARFSYPGFKEVSEVVAILNGEELDVTLSLEVV